jgi:hypothetical protein
MTTVEKPDELTVEELDAVSGGFTMELQEVYTSRLQISGSGGQTPTESMTITPR